MIPPPTQTNNPFIDSSEFPQHLATQFSELFAFVDLLDPQAVSFYPSKPLSRHTINIPVNERDCPLAKIDNVVVPFLAALMVRMLFHSRARPELLQFHLLCGLPWGLLSRL